MDREAIESGFEFEEEMAELLGLEQQPGSGNTPWYKLDLTDGSSILLSLKWTGKKSFPLSDGLMHEVDRAVSAPGGVGGDTLGGALIGVGGRAILCMDVRDVVRMLQEKRRLGMQSKAEARRERARIPQLMREDYDEG